MNKIFDCIIIGGGPSGLAAGNILSDFEVDFLVIEKGNYLYKRTPEKPSDIVSGIGGGGLFSDGKLSFFPSGSKLYSLNSLFLNKSYKYLYDLLEYIDISIPPYDENWQDKIVNSSIINDTIKNKNYDSLVLSQDQLYKFGFYLYDKIGKNRFLINSEVVNISFDQEIYTIEVLSNGYIKKYTARNIIFSGGKFGSLHLNRIFRSVELIFKKFEFGFRIETDDHHFDFNDIRQTDLKLLMASSSKAIEFRTFCFCRNGYIVNGKFDDYNTFNGVSNKLDFKKTNFGFNLRIEEKEVYIGLSDGIHSFEKADPIADLPIKEFLLNPRNWNAKVFKLFKNSLENYFPQVCKSNATISGPSFEYFGYYPKLNSELKVDGQNIWVNGDATGDFRGLVPALVSGFISAYSLIEKSKKDKKLLYDLVRLKESPILKKRTIFTAQSKKFFYCKDVICEFVFKKGAIPLNPFQVFGYFLNERVERVLVRNGNNELISRCDELWIFGPIADGVLFEIYRAYELNMPIRYFTIGTILKDIVEISDLSKIVFEPEVYSQIGKENLLRFLSQSYSSIEEKAKIQLQIDFDDVE